MTAVEMLKLLLPPVALQAWRRLHRPGAGRRAGAPAPVEWEYVADGWTAAAARLGVKGWGVDDVVEVARGKWARFVALTGGTGPLGFTFESGLKADDDVVAHNTIMSFAYVLARAAGGRRELSLLDWGGGVGQYALYARALLPGLRLQYHCKDLPPQAGAGREFVSDGRFHADEACLERTYDVVMACGSLHYTQAWQPLLGRLAGATADSLYLAHVPTVRVVPSFIFIQRPYRYGYRTEYLGWCLNRDEVVAAAGSSGLKLVREFVYGYRPQIQSAPEQNEYRGYLFQPARAASD